MPFEPLPLTADTLTALLNEGTERAGLDFKRRCNLNDKFELVSIVKDMGAMQIDGGYLVVGADDRGQPSGEVTEAEAKLFDQATVQSKVAPYLPEGFDIRSAYLEVDGNWFGLICILPHPEGVAPFKATGNAVHPQTEKPVVAFRAGDVFSRHGTKSEPWTMEDVRKVRATIRHQEREAAREEYGQLLAQQQSSGGAQTAARGPAASLTWKMDPGTLSNIVMEQVRQSDDIPVTLLLKSAPREASAYAVTGDSDGLDTLLDGVVCLAATMLTIGRPTLADAAVDALAAIYDTSFDQQGMDRGDMKVSVADLRLRVVGRVWALGALATREGQLEIVRKLAVHRPASYDPGWWHTWLFHGLVMAARAGLLQDPNNQLGKSMLVIAQEHIVRLACLRPDLDPADEQVMTSLCQFDMLADLAALSTPGAKHNEAFFANFARWFASRSDPAAVLVIEDPRARDIIFGGGTDQELADALAAIASNAQKMSGFMHGWHGYEDQRIVSFLQQHPPRQWRSGR